jgi:hypothetical protein
VKLPELTEDQGGFDGRKQRLDYRGFQKSCHLPNGGGRPKLAGNGHHDEVRALALIGLGADYDGGTLLGRSLVGEGERD